MASKLLSKDTINSHGTEGGDYERHSNAGWDECAIRHGAHASGIGLPPTPDNDAPDADKDWAFGRPELNINSQFGQCHPYFGSSHNGGINACLADGSVRFIAFNVDAEAFRRVSLTDSKLPNILDE